MVKGESNSDWRRQGVKSLKFHYRRSKDWLPVDIDEILLPDELEDDKVLLPDELEDDKLLLPDELEDKEDITHQISGSGGYDPDDDTPDIENYYGLYSNSDDEGPSELVSRGGYDSSDDESEDDDEDSLDKADEDIGLKFRHG